MGVKSVKSISQSASGCDKEVWEVLNATCNIHSQITVVIIRTNCFNVHLLYLKDLLTIDLL
jgi:hypothetical protein